MIWAHSRAVSVCLRTGLGRFDRRGESFGMSFRRRTEPEKVRDLGLRAEVKWTEAGTIPFKRRGR
jgi:hypothetical protein